VTQPPRELSPQSEALEALEPLEALGALKALDLTALERALQSSIEL